MKLDSNFKLSKPTKYLMSSILNKTDRNIFKKAMINAESELQSKERMMMLYDIGPGGKKIGQPKKKIDN